MTFKNFLYLLLVTITFVACKPTSNVITSKREAEKKGIYKTSNDSKLVIAKSKTNTNKTVKSTDTSKSTKTSKGKKGLINEENDDDYVANTENENYLASQLINTALEYNGVRYRGGGTTSAGMDCSGLVFTTFSTFDIKLPRSSYEQSQIGVKINDDDVQKGDLVFFKTNRRKRQINHVGLVVEVNDDEIKFIHASVQRGVIISSTKEPYYKNSYVQANRVLQQ
ncbi:C40 family peptidase [Flavobacterium sp. '19STA2R22 D10 B1']|uniref:C40 family peptidase n=1 Tax=Flavobacterium aerium TaxID=3037261 RepID=UPI00278BDF3E|nr:NlpC/P60 family protein [Flavobacterium sp. '19STA2R22 D10 B1']